MTLDEACERYWAGVRAEICRDIAAKRRADRIRREVLSTQEPRKAALMFLHPEAPTILHARARHGRAVSDEDMRRLRREAEYGL